MLKGISGQMGTRHMSRRNVGDQSEQIFILALRIDHRIHSADSLHDRIEFALAEFFLLHINELKFNSSFLEEALSFARIRAFLCSKYLYIHKHLKFA